MHRIECHYSIGAVERDTGIGHDTLRIWERRCGFPKPLRNEKGERSYSEIQLRRLQRIRRLLDQGLRPGKLVPLSKDALDELETRLAAQQPEQIGQAVNALLDAVCSGDARRIEALCREQYDTLGMKEFIPQTLVPLLSRVGELWSVGKLQVFQEHFLSQQLNRFLNTEITKLQQSAGEPRVLLATLPGEQHTLGLLMVAGLLTSRGASVINLGAEVPMQQLEQAVEQFRADTVGITFSGAYPYKSIRSHLFELRELLPADVEIWVGGEGLRRLCKLPTGVTKFKSIDEASSA
ncbi:MAG: MerR family transcriptional regulator [Thiogranum sp.]